MIYKQTDRHTHTHASMRKWIFRTKRTSKRGDLMKPRDQNFCDTKAPFSLYAEYKKLIYTGLINNTM